MRAVMPLVLVAAVLSARADCGMKTEANSKTIEERTFEADLVVCGGGLSGVCAAIAAARHGTQTILIQDRPMLGGNASSEVRMGICGATGDNNKEGGILEELQLTNIHDNPLMRYTIWDDVLLTAVVREKNIRLMLNTSVNDVETRDGRIVAVKTWNSHAYTRDTVRGRMFIDCTGDGILRLSGAKFRRGRELPDEFGEDFLKEGGDARTMGNSILMQLRKTTVHRPFKAPEWAHHFTDADFEERDSTIGILKNGFYYTFKRPHPENGKGGYNNFWWIEYGGSIDTVRDANAIQFELKRIAYGVWEYMKNHPDGRCRGYELDWIGALPGKRESTRFVGPHILTQGDIMSGRSFPDVVAYGGWVLDDHHPDAFFNKGYMAVAHKGPSPFQIPLRCLYSVNVPNLMFAGRDISVTHMGLSATRVMGTCAALGQAAGTAAAVAIARSTTPDGVYRAHLAELQTMLEDDDCMLPGRWRKVSALTSAARVEPAAGEVLKNGIDRDYAGRDNGVWLAPGESVVYRWDSAKRLSGARLVFDSIMQNQWKYDKRLRKLEATTEYEKLPPPLAKEFDVEVEVGGRWRRVASDGDNYLRLRRVVFDEPAATALRLTVRSAWGGGKAHVFGFDAL